MRGLSLGTTHMMRAVAEEPHLAACGARNIRYKDVSRMLYVAEFKPQR